MPPLGFPSRHQSGLLSGMETLTWLLTMWAMVGTVPAAGQLGGDRAPFTARVSHRRSPLPVYTCGTDWGQNPQAPSSLRAFAHAVPSACSTLAPVCSSPGQVLPLQVSEQASIPRDHLRWPDATPFQLRALCTNPHTPALPLQSQPHCGSAVFTCLPH